MEIIVKPWRKTALFCSMAKHPSCLQHHGEETANSNTELTSAQRLAIAVKRNQERKRQRRERLNVIRGMRKKYAVEQLEEMKTKDKDEKCLRDTRDRGAKAKAKLDIKLTAMRERADTRREKLHKLLSTTLERTRRGTYSHDALTAMLESVSTNHDISAIALTAMLKSVSEFSTAITKADNSVISADSVTFNNGPSRTLDIPITAGVPALALSAVSKYGDPTFVGSDSPGNDIEPFDVVEVKEEVLKNEPFDMDDSCSVNQAAAIFSRSNEVPKTESTVQPEASDEQATINLPVTRCQAPLLMAYRPVLVASGSGGIHCPNRPVLRVKPEVFDQNSRSDFTITPDIPVFGKTQNSSQRVPYSIKSEVILPDNIEEQEGIANGVSDGGDDQKPVINESAEVESPKPACQGCHARGVEFVCSGCHNQWYCSRSCQIAAWDRHSAVCRPVVETAEEIFG